MISVVKLLSKIGKFALFFFFFLRLVLQGGRERVVFTP